MRIGRAIRRWCAALALLTVGPASADDHAVVFIYHHVADSTPPSTSISPAAFMHQMDYLSEGGFNVLPLTEILDAVAGGRTLPARAVALTFDDAYQSVYSTVWPALSARGWPFTVFVATDAVDRGARPYMNWAELEELAAAGVAIANHGAAHGHPFDGPAEHRIARFKADVLKGAHRLQERLGVSTRLYAYPYGEYDSDLEAVIAELGIYGLGQQSGALGPGTPLTSVPRFPISTSFADLEAFALRATSAPLPVTVIEPRSRLLQSGDRAARLVLALDGAAVTRSTLSCFDSAGSPLTVDWLNTKSFSVQAAGRVPPGRSKYTCTAPRPGAPGEYAWYSHLWIGR